MSKKSIARRGLFKRKSTPSGRTSERIAQMLSTSKQKRSRRLARNRPLSGGLEGVTRGGRRICYREVIVKRRTKCPPRKRTYTTEQKSRRRINARLRYQTNHTIRQ